MATATMATAAGAAALLYYTMNKKLQSQSTIDDDEDSGSDAPTDGRFRVTHRLIEAPATWLETISTLSETLRFTYSETLGKWPIGDLAFGISFLLKRQGNYLVDSVFGGTDSVQLKGPEITAELKHLLNLLTLCWHFSKKSFPSFLEATGYTDENVLLREAKAGILKPAFTIIVDHKMRRLLLLIRGTHSIKDTLTAVTGTVVPFHHTVVHQGGVSDLVLGYAHCGMVAAARWIAKLATPCLLDALGRYPDYEVKIVGHSLGGGTAAILTYVLREQKELSVATCVTFAPAACMTWELAESGCSFITSIINGADLVPTFSAASVDDLRSEVTASAWINDLRNQIEQTRILSTVYRSASALGSRLPSIASARAKVAGAGAMLQPVSNGTQVVMKRAKSMAQAAWTRPNLNLTSWSCMGPRRRATAAHSQFKEEGSPTSSGSDNAECSDPLCSRNKGINAKSMNLPVSSSVDEWSTEIECVNESNAGDEVDDDVHLNENMIDHHRYEDQMSEVELWQQLEHELYDRPEGEEAEVAKEIREEEEAAITEVVGQNLALPRLPSIRLFLTRSFTKNLSSTNSHQPVLWSIGSRHEELKSLNSGSWVQVYSNGDVYEGEFHKGKCSGSGVYHFHMSGRFEGDWVDGKYDGFGVETWARGSRYRGQYRKGLRHGVGIYRFFGGDVYTGEWCNGHCHGAGVHTCSDGSHYVGEFKWGVKHGLGRYHFRNGDIYAGEYFADMMHGFGVYRFQNGHQYEGAWHEGRRQGLGMYTFRNGETQCGHWQNGILDNPKKQDNHIESPCAVDHAKVSKAVQDAHCAAEKASSISKMDETVNKVAAAANKAANAARVAAVKAVQNTMHHNNSNNQ